jgi:hypothetical protein
MKVFSDLLLIPEKYILLGDKFYKGISTIYAKPILKIM